VRIHALSTVPSRPTISIMQRVLVTGTSSGFGRLTALSLARRGHHVIATMRDPDGKNRDKAAHLRGVAGIEVRALDVTSDDSVTAAIAAAGELDAVINNAGRATIGLAETITPAQLLRDYDTNVIGMQRVNRAVLPAMRARRRGLIVCVSSGLGRLVMPVVGLYASTKWAVEAMAETYRYDLKPTGVELTIVQPGAYPTDFGSQEPAGDDQARAAGYGPLAGALDAFKQRMTKPSAADPQQVADAIVRLVEAEPGTRPARLSVDATGAPLTVRLNDAHAEVQRELLTAIGMANLAD
jgi:NAD(P)-dependent dehydrogenase (short-subunit alcohol dehydrogenase family)